jgi:carboxyl-terminal processing protease
MNLCNRKRRLLGAFLALGWVLFAAGLLVPRVFAVGSGGYQSLETFANILAIVQRNYVKEVETEKLITGAIEGMLGSLDPHSSYLTGDAYRELQTETEGRFGGLGLEITVRNGVLTVISPIEGTPAARAGVQPGDQIVGIDDRSTEELGLADAVKRLRGPKGSSVTIAVRREGQDKLLKFTIVRDVIEINSVRAHVLESGFLYARIAQFQDRTSESLRAALAKVQPGGEPIKGFVLDLRNNPGGLLNQAVGVSDLFLDSGLIVYTDGRQDQQKQKFSASRKDSRTGFPMVVLVNGGSASASEIVAGALQDHKRALILGTKTFGKGSVQTILPLGGRSALRLTTAQYFTPNGRSIHDIGIQPDIVMDRSTPPSPSGTGTQAKSSETETPPASKSPAQGSVAPDSTVQRLKSDPQVERALELLKGWEMFRGLAGSAKAT